MGKSFLSRIFSKRHASTRGPSYVAALREGRRQLRQGNYERAIAFLTEALLLDDKAVDAHVAMGQALKACHKIEAARLAYFRAYYFDNGCRDAIEGIRSLPGAPPGREDFSIGDELRSDSNPDGRYIVRDIKRGGFGIVYIADLMPGATRVALKTFQSRFLWSDEDRERFITESKTWLGLPDHPQIVQAMWMERIEGRPILALEYVHGGDLRGYMENRKISPQACLRIALDICSGMAAANARTKLVHRDLKPENCLLDTTGRVKVTDFGISHVVSDDMKQALADAPLPEEASLLYTMPAGTPPYMAPEQFDRFGKLDVRTDIHALGVMIYEMLTGDRPANGAKAAKHIEEQGPQHKIAAPWLDLVLQCVATEPNNRPRDFNVLADRLESLDTSRSLQSTTPINETSADSNSRLNDRAVSLLELGRADEAIELFDQVLSSNPNDSVCMGNKALALLALGRTSEALDLLQRGLEKEPNSRALWKNKGIALQRLLRHGEALHCFEQSLKSDPTDPGSWVGKAGTLESLRRPQEAIACYKEALAQDARDYKSWCNLGVLLTNQQQYREAMGAFERALEINPRDELSWTNRAHALRSLGRPKEAMDSLDRAIECNVRSTHAWTSKGELLEELRRFDEADTCYDRLAELMPD